MIRADIGRHHRQQHRQASGDAVAEEGGHEVWLVDMENGRNLRLIVLRTERPYNPRFPTNTYWCVGDPDRPPLVVKYGALGLHEDAEWDDVVACFKEAYPSR
jgi:hypothetical protein